MYVIFNISGVILSIKNKNYYSLNVTWDINITSWLFLERTETKNV